MGYQYSVWLVPKIWNDIKKVYETEHVPHITIKSLLSLEHARDLFKQYDNEYKITFQNDIYDFKQNDSPASGFYCKVLNLETEKQLHMTINYKFNKKVIPLEAPEDLIGNIYIVNTTSDKPEKWCFV
jgi:hypothetical protein